MPRQASAGAGGVNGDGRKRWRATALQIRFLGWEDCGLRGGAGGAIGCGGRGGAAGLTRRSRGGMDTADAEASLGWGGGREWARAKAVASHRTPNTLRWLGSLWSSRGAGGRGGVYAAEAWRDGRSGCRGKPRLGRGW